MKRVYIIIWVHETYTILKERCEMETKFEIEESLQNLEALIDLLHTASGGGDQIETETLGAITNIMSNTLMDLRRALKTE